MITMLAGGSGAAKFIRGMIEIIPQDDIAVIGNTGDDVTVWGLYVSPDLDTVMYVLAGMLDEERGWGIRGDTFDCLDAMGRYGAITWFQLGDRDLATHLERTRWLQQGSTLTGATAHLCRLLNVTARLLPMSNERVETHIETPGGSLSFQEFFVRDRWSHEVKGVEYSGSAFALPAPGVLESLRTSGGVIVAPSNPVTSIGPILAVDGIRVALQQTKVPVVAVSPIIGKEAVSGPAAKLLQVVCGDVSALGVAQHYHDIIDAIVIDQRDSAIASEIESLGIRVLTADTVMTNLKAKVRLAEDVMSFLERMKSN